MNGSDVTIYDMNAPVLSNLEVLQLATGFKFTEGPVWHPDGFLLFSDIPANKIYQLYPHGELSIFLDNSGCNNCDTSLLSDMIGSNGLAIDHHQHLIICQHGNHGIAGLDKDKKMYVLTDRFDTRPFNSPNDLVISADDSIYFTDPPYGLKEQVLHPHLFQSGAGLYRYHDGETRLLNTDLRYPNGVCFSPGEEFLYVGSNHPDEPIIWKYTLKNGAINHQSFLIEHNADGIETDDKGRVFLATDDGILIVSPAGKRLALISLPESPSNLAWGKEKYKELYITARSSVYSIKYFN
jgi:gluconolactonase